MDEDAELLVDALETRWREALRDDDIAELDELTARDYTFVSSYGIQTKEEWLEELRAAKKKSGHRSVTYENSSATVYENVAVFYAEQWIEFPMNDTMTEEWAMLVTDVWLRRNHIWRIVRRHSSTYLKKNPSYKRQREHL